MKLIYYSVLLGLLTVASCQKKLAVKDAPDFSVATEGTSFKANTPVTFNITGSADIISFYSGELFREYEYRNGREIDISGKGLTLSFKTSVAAGSPAGTQADQFSILMSTDFSGNYKDLASVKAATWKNVTDSFKLATNATFITTKTVDLSQFVLPGKPIFFALKYMNKPQIANGFARQWLVESFTLNSKDTLSNGTSVNIANQGTIGFRIVDENFVNAPSRSSVSPTRVTLYGPVYKNPNDPLFNPDNPIFNPKNPIYNPDSTAYVIGAKVPIFVPYDPASPYNDPQSEIWAVSAPITTGKINLAMDKSIAVRSSIYAAKPTSYKYTYKVPGTYKAYFVASNNTIDESKEVVKELTITVTP